MIGCLASWRGDAGRIVDKMPDNYVYLGLIRALYPRATLIHCCRDLYAALFVLVDGLSKRRWTNATEHIAPTAWCWRWPSAGGPGSASSSWDWACA